jgi:hypothetical protein
MDVGEWTLLILGSGIGISLLVLAYNWLGKYVKTTETKLDDRAHAVFPKVIDFVIDNFDMGETEKIMDGFLEKLEEIDEDTTDLEDIIKAKKDDIKKPY